jgi:hypothetical protein
MLHLRHFFQKNQKVLLIVGTLLFFLITFIISVAGGLRVFFPYLGELTGLPFGQKNYLIVFQNNNELRPGGGFISSFGKIQFTAGFPTGIQIEDVYGQIDEHARLPAPYPMEKLLANEWYKGYSFRDGNYSPNFPDSAQELTRLYHLTRPNEKIDGLIALNFSVLEDLLDALGPISVEGKYLSKDNLFEELTNQVNDVDRHNLASLANRKSILKPLANAVIKKILLNPFKLRKVSDMITRSLTKKDLQLYFYGENLQKLAEKNGWAGEWPTTRTGDFLAINEANLGGMKSDRYIDRRITYKVKFSEEYFRSNAAPEANLKVEVNHFGIENIPLSGPYTGFFRIFTSPEQVKSAFRADAPLETANLFNQPVISRALEEIIKLQPGQSQIIEKKYPLPRDIIKDGFYSLYIPKQSGAAADLYTVIIELPRGYRIESDTLESRENIGFWQGTLTTDLKLKLKVVEDQSPPHLIQQENTELNHISIHFNEDLNQNFAADPFSYQITDLNINHPETTDQIRLRKVETTAKDIHLYLTGQTSQPEEHYGIQLKNLRDTHGNVLSDRQITVVQRVR